MRRVRVPYPQILEQKVEHILAFLEDPDVIPHAEWPCIVAAHRARARAGGGKEERTLGPGWAGHRELGAPGFPRFWLRTTSVVRSLVFWVR